jgi:hypothetical protein
MRIIENLYMNEYTNVEQDGKEGALNSKSELVIPFEYEAVYEFSNGLFFVKKNGKWGYINEKNEVVIPFIFDHAFGFYGHSYSIGRIDSEIPGWKPWKVFNSKGEILYSMEEAEEAGKKAHKLNGIEF